MVGFNEYLILLYLYWWTLIACFILYIGFNVSLIVDSEKNPAKKELNAHKIAAISCLVFSLLTGIPVIGYVFLSLGIFVSFIGAIIVIKDFHEKGEIYSDYTDTIAVVYLILQIIALLLGIIHFSALSYMNRCINNKK